MTDLPRDRLRELLDAVLDGDAGGLDDMARRAFASPAHFSRQFRDGTRESPVAMRRRVVLERAAWRLRSGASVTDVALAEGYGSLEGFSRAFSRAFGVPPSELPPDAPFRLPAPNGIHFHPPTSLWIDRAGGPAAPPDPTASSPIRELLEHDLDDTRYLVDVASGLRDEQLEAELLPGHRVLPWEEPDDRVASVLDNLVWSREVWQASIDGDDLPERGDRGPATLRRRLDDAGPRWIATVDRLHREGRFDDTLIDALCDPPESFVISRVVLHTITFAAHRRLLVRHLFRRLGVEVDDGDPIVWNRGEP